MKQILPGFYALLLFAALSQSCAEKDLQKGSSDGQEQYVEIGAIEEIYIPTPCINSPEFSTDYVSKEVKRQKSYLAAVLVYHGVPLRFGEDAKIMVPETVATDSVFLQKLLYRAKDTAWCRHNLPLR
jgi:hypothetical protein